MNLRDILSPLRRWWWLLILGAILPTGISYYIASNEPPYYEAKATIMVGTTIESTAPNPATMNTSTALARVYAELVKRRPITEAVIQRLDLERSPTALSNHITTSVLADAQLLEITVTDHEPELAADLANALAEELIRQSPASMEEAEEQHTFALSQLGDLQQKIEDMDQKIADLQASLALMTSAAEIDEAEQTLTALEQLQATYQSSYASLLLSVEDASNALTLVESAAAPSTPIDNRLPLIVALSGSIGLALTGAAVYFMEHVDDRLRYEDRWQEMVGDLPVLGALPRMPKVDGPLIAYPSQGSPEAEALSALQANILLARDDGLTGNLLITSGLPHEGKSVVAANLAAGYAATGTKVILVDANLRKPSLHELLGLPNGRGLSDLLQSGDTDLNQVLQEIENSHLSLLCGGEPPADPVALLLSPHTQRIFSVLKELPALVVIDSPALWSGPEARILASMADGIILVVKSASTGRDAVRHAREQLEGHGAPIVGVAFTDVKLSSRFRIGSRQ